MVRTKAKQECLNYKKWILEQLMNIQPKDPSKNHFYVSLVKSGLRIAAGGFLLTANVFLAGVLLIGAELLGIAEELV